MATNFDESDLGDFQEGDSSLDPRLSIKESEVHLEEKDLPQEEDPLKEAAPEEILLDKEDVKIDEEEIK